MRLKPKCEQKASPVEVTGRFKIYRISHDVKPDVPTWGLYGPVREALIGAHRTKELAVAEMDAVFPRIVANEMLLLWDDKDGRWVATEYCYYGPGE